MPSPTHSADRPWPDGRKYCQTVLLRFAMRVTALAMSGSFEARKTFLKCFVFVASRMSWSFDSGISPQKGASETKWGTPSTTGQSLPHDAQRHSSSEHLRPPAHHGHAHSGRVSSLFIVLFVRVHYCIRFSDPRHEIGGPQRHMMAGQIRPSEL